MSDYISREAANEMLHYNSDESCAEKGKIVSFYQDIVKMLEEGMKNDVG